MRERYVLSHIFSTTLFLSLFSSVLSSFCFPPSSSLSKVFHRYIRSFKSCQSSMQDKRWHCGWSRMETSCLLFSVFCWVYELITKHCILQFDDSIRFDSIRFGSVRRFDSIRDSIRCLLFSWFYWVLFDSITNSLDILQFDLIWFDWLSLSLMSFRYFYHDNCGVTQFSINPTGEVKISFTNRRILNLYISII